MKWVLTRDDAPFADLNWIIVNVRTVTVTVNASLRDATSGIAAFRREAISPILPTLNPKGFKLLLEILAKAKGLNVKESPIVFGDRQFGRSKFNNREIFLFLKLCLNLRISKGRRQP